MLLSAHRPQNRIGEVSFRPHSREEELVRLIAIVTEGSKEELVYLKSYIETLEKRYNKHVQIHFINDFIHPDIWDSEQKASHPLRRLELLKEYLFRVNPDFQQYPDESWLVCDRDDQSFKEEQYDEIAMYCTTHQIRLAISNPAFQLWLLFHFDSWLREDIFEDELNSPQRLEKIERRLKQILPYYHHGNLVFGNYANRIKQAIQNSCKYCTNINQLKTEIGTNFSLLIRSIEKCYVSTVSTQ